jgi:hypothetical protein
VHDACSTGDVADPLFALGPQVDVILEEPADDPAHVGGKTASQLGGVMAFTSSEPSHPTTPSMA